VKRKAKGLKRTKAERARLAREHDLKVDLYRVIDRARGLPPRPKVWGA